MATKPSPLTPLQQQAAVKAAKAAAVQAVANKALTAAQLRVALSAAQTQAADTEAAARKSLAEAADTMSRLKLAAAAASDRELKAQAEADALREQLAATQEAQAHRLTAEPTQDLSAQIGQLQAQVEGLLAENQRLAKQRDAAQADNQTLFQRLDTSAEREKAAVTAAVQATAAAQEAKAKVAAESLRLGAARIAALSTQLGSAGKLEVLAPDQVGHLMGGFLQQLETGMPTLRLAEGELKLKLGLARSDQQDGFVILPPNASAELRSSLHEISLRFDRAGGTTVLKTDAG
jgi:regulator of replication initiation timing